MTTYTIALLPGDGVGPEVVEAARRVLCAVDELFGWDLRFETHPIGGAALDSHGVPLPAETLRACRAADAVLLGAVGGPAWDDAPTRPEAGLLELRKALGLFANLRPVMVTEATLERSPLKPAIVRGADLLIVRELTGGAYFGEKRRTGDFASDLCAYAAEEIERVARVAFVAARGRNGRVASIDKANVLETSRLWRETVSRLHARDFADVTLEHALVDSAAMRLVLSPRTFDVILTENMFGDILSDQAAALPGSIGLLGSASLGGEGPGLFEPIHGSAPDIAGTDRANPVGALRSAAMLLSHGLKLPFEAEILDGAVSAVLASGVATADLGGEATCSGFADEVIAALQRARWTARAGSQMHWA